MEINNIHDKFFKATLGNISVAKKFLKFFLPEYIIENIELNTLSFAKMNFVSENLKEIFSDLIFSCELKNEEKTLISILLEHKSRPDKKTPVQILKYITAGYDQQFTQNGKLTPIITIVFYHGEKKWRIKSLNELMENIPNEVRNFVPSYEVIFIDLKSVSDYDLELIGNSMLFSFLFLQKYSDRPDEIEKKIKLIFNKLDSVRDRNYLRIFVVYILNVVKNEIIMDTINQSTQTIKKEFKSAYETLKDKAIREGMEKGMEKGMQKGMEKGIQKEKLEVIKRGWKNGFSISDLAVLSGLDEKEIELLVKEFK